MSNLYENYFLHILVHLLVKLSDLLWTLTLSTVENHSVLLNRPGWTSGTGPVELHLSRAQFREQQVSRTGVGEGRVYCGPRLHSCRHSNMGYVCLRPLI